MFASSNENIEGEYVIHVREKRNLLDLPQLSVQLRRKACKRRFDKHWKGQRCRMEHNSTVEIGCGFKFQSHKK